MIEIAVKAAPAGDGSPQDPGDSGKRTGIGFERYFAD
jgi:hypothetical protein